MRVALCFMSGNASFSGGVDQVVWTRAQMLVEHGHSVVIFCQANEGLSEPSTRAGVSICPVHCQQISARRVGVLHPFLSRYMADELAREHMNQQFDLIDLHDSPLAGSMSRFADIHGIPVAFTIHSATAQIPEPRIAPIQKYLLESERVAVERSDLLLPVSAYVGSAFDGLTRGKLVRVVHNTVSAEAEQVGSEPVVRDDSPQVLNMVFAARLETVKGLDVLLKAVGALKPQVQPGKLSLHLDVFGRGGEDVNLRKMSADLGLEGLVTFRGFESDRYKILRAIAKADAFVAPTRYEALSISAIEALSCGTPTVLSDIPPCREVGADAALFFPLDDSNALAQTIKTLADDVSMRQAYAAKAKERAHAFRKEVIFPHLIEAYEEAVFARRTKLISISRTASPKISVIIPAYNLEKYISQAVLSAANQSYSAAEIIVGDDSSTDETRALAESLGAKVVTGPKANGSVARNRAAAEATGDLLFFLDGDDWWHPAKVEAHLAEWEVRPGASFVYDPAFVFPQGQKSSGTIGEFGTRDPDWRMFLHWQSWASGSCFSIRRENYERMGGFREELVALQDVDFWVRTAEALGPAHRLPRAYTYYRILPKSVSRSPKNVVANLENALAGWTFLNDRERKEFSRQVLLTAARWCRLKESLYYVNQAGWPVTKSKTWKVLARATVSSARGLLRSSE